MAEKDEKSGNDDSETGAGLVESAARPGTQSTTQTLMNLMKRSLGLADKENYPDQILETLDINGIAQYIADQKCKNIITMAGAGISTSAGIPDFRSPGTGLYDNLQKYNLPSPQAMFDIDFFKENPKPFFELAKELWPGIFKPTWCHYFIKLLDSKGLLLRHYSQNIDTLERVASINPDKIVEAHGTFHTSHCVQCEAEYTQEWIKEKIFADEIPACSQDNCGGLVKPDIVFFGEKLPSRFFECIQEDLEKCDLLIILGTSLVVQPFASIPNRVQQGCPRLYVNMEKEQGNSDPLMAMLGMGHGFRYDAEDNYRDVFWQGTCDDGCKLLAKHTGWEKELDDLVKGEHSKIDAQIKQEKRKVERIKKVSSAKGPRTTPDKKRVTADSQDKSSKDKNTGVDDIQCSVEKMSVTTDPKDRTSKDKGRGSDDVKCDTVGKNKVSSGESKEKFSDDGSSKRTDNHAGKL